MILTLLLFIHESWSVQKHAFTVAGKYVAWKQMEMKKKYLLNFWNGAAVKLNVEIQFWTFYLSCFLLRTQKRLSFWICQMFPMKVIPLLLEE
jgi:hypothetical protein